MTTEAAIARWHEAVNEADIVSAMTAVSDPVVVLGPRAAASITPAEFADWVSRSGIRLTARSWHAVSDHLMVVEQWATWPDAHEPVEVATLFRVSAGKVSAALRMPSIEAALELAAICRELAASA